MNKKGGWILWVSIILIVLLIAGMFFYLALFKVDNSDKYTNIVNPASELSDEQAIAQFNETFVLYILYMIKAYNLHNPPLSSNKPQIEFIIDEEVYSAVVDDGLISVQKRRIDEKDAIIKMGRKEGVKIIRDPSYITKSFDYGGSDIEFVAEKSTLFS